MRTLQDASLLNSIALPDAAGSVTTPDLDLGSAQGAASSSAGNQSEFPENVEIQVLAPALTATQMPTGTILTVQLQSGPSAGPTTAYEQPISITSASGIAKSTYRFRVPYNIARYLNAKFTTANGTGTAGNCAASAGVIQLVF